MEEWLASDVLTQAGTDPPLFGDFALGLQLGASLPSLQNTVVLFGVDVQRFLFQHLSPRQWDSLHSGNGAAARNHLNKTRRGRKEKQEERETEEFSKMFHKPFIYPVSV